MKVLMFGWEFPPMNTGGLGTACYGITKGLAQNGVSITLVLPQAPGESEASGLGFLKIRNANVTNLKIKSVKSAMVAYMNPQDYEQRMLRLKGRKPIWPEKPEDIVGRDVCNLTGLLPTPENSCDTRHEFFWEKFLPETLRSNLCNPQRLDLCFGQREIWIRKDTGAPPDPAIPLDQQGELELQTHTVISDPLVPEFCLDCAYPIEQELNPDGTVKQERINYPGSVIEVNP
jgi:hypothetical protein